LLLLQPTAGTLVLQITLTALLYLGLLLVTRCIGTDEFEMMRAIFRNRKIKTNTPRLSTSTTRTTHS
jgi:hypothetical protein